MQEQESRKQNRYEREDRSRRGDSEYSAPPANLPSQPQEGDIYTGTVQNVKTFGCFVRLDHFQPPWNEGLVHVSQISRSRINDPSEVVSRNQRVKVKVLRVIGGKVGLSMREVDQATGKDLRPNKPEAHGVDSLRSNPERPSSFGVAVSSHDQDDADDFDMRRRRGRRKKTGNEAWELTQLKNAGVLAVEDRPDVDEEAGVLNYEEDEFDIEIELREDEPAFLQGQTTASLDLSPIKVVKNPDGSMQRAVLTQQALTKERRELKQQELMQEQDAIPADLGRVWEDPMAEHKHFAADIKNIVSNSYELPEWKKETFGKNVTYGQVTNKTIQEQREGLPIYALRNELLQAFHDNQILVVIGETGSGKTTQMTQYLAEAGYTRNGRIGCTQPRRVAAMSVAKRVAEEFGCRLGQEVGYCIRFEDCTSPETQIKYMTDGMLLRELLIDRDASKYSVIMLDEAHERTISTDVLFGLLKSACKRRPDLKLIVTSATLDAEKFSDYFNNCPIFTIPGRMFPVSIMHAQEPEQDYLDAALITAMQIHLGQPKGDILIFLTGKEEIDTACEILFDRMQSIGREAPPLLVLPVYSALPSELQTRIFEPAPDGSRKCIIATNIAEASLTIDGIHYVVDPGFCKQKVYDPKLGMDSLVVTPISQASANQRAGRAGRTGPGKCFRLYTEQAYRNEMLPSSVPEIQRTNLGNTVLTLKAMGINDLLGFGFMDPPPVQTLIMALSSLYALSALDDDGLLTRLGRKMAEFPLDPNLGKMLIASVDLGCTVEVLTIVAMLSVEEVFYRPRDKQAQADMKKAKFFQPEGDHLTLLSVYNAWEASKYSNSWCMENFVQQRSLKRAQDVRKQLVGIVDKYRLPIKSCGRDWGKIQQAIASGYFMNAAKKDPQEGYKTLVENQPVYIHPSSSLFNKQPEWVIYHKLVLTTKEYMRDCMAIEPKWLVDLAPQFFQVSDPNKISKRKKKEKIEPLYDRFRPGQEWRLSRRKG